MSVSIHARVYLVVAACAALLAVAAMPLALRARGRQVAASRLVQEDLVLASSVAETRALTLHLRLTVAETALAAGEDTGAERFRSENLRLADELRRARLHTSSEGVQDMTDDLDNSRLRFAAGAERVFAAAGAGRTADARALALALGREGAELAELAEELTTAGATTAGVAARGLDGGGATLGLLLLALIGTVVALHAASLAAAESGTALTAAATRALPRQVRRYLPAAWGNTGGDGAPPPDTRVDDAPTPTEWDARAPAASGRGVSSTEPVGLTEPHGVSATALELGAGVSDGQNNEGSEPDPTDATIDETDSEGPLTVEADDGVKAVDTRDAA